MGVMCIQTEKRKLCYNHIAIDMLDENDFSITEIALKIDFTYEVQNYQSENIESNVFSIGLHMSSRNEFIQYHIYFWFDSTIILALYT